MVRASLPGALATISPNMRMCVRCCIYSSNTQHLTNQTTASHQPKPLSCAEDSMQSVPRVTTHQRRTARPGTHLRGQVKKLGFQSAVHPTSSFEASTFHARVQSLLMGAVSFTRCCAASSPVPFPVPTGEPVLLCGSWLQIPRTDRRVVGKEVFGASEGLRSAPLSVLATKFPFD
jgi:hypothetical protein